MALTGPEFYDDENVFATYIARRARPEGAYETLEKPVFDELVGDLMSLRILDLGCGDARFGQEAVQAGCHSYLGIEGSQRMVELARTNLDGVKAQVVRARIETWPYPDRHFDLVTSRLVLHYIEDIDGTLVNIYHTLVDGGRFVCSIEHPVITSCDRAWQTGGLRQDWIVDNYFETGQRVTSWMGGEAIKYHRTVEGYFVALQAAGFIVDALRESRPQRIRFSDEETYRRRKRIPLILFFLASRPPTTT